MSMSRILAGVCAAALLAAPAWPQSVWAEPAPATLSAHDLALLNRITWGATPSSAAEMARMGARRWLQAQLHPPADDRLPAAVQAEIDAMPYAREPLLVSLERMAGEHAAQSKLTDPTARAAAAKAIYDERTAISAVGFDRTLLRDLYSPDQLKEQMTWFWTNHFNVHYAKLDVSQMEGDYEDRAIRPRALGRFRDLLEASLRHPAMLSYLENDKNAVGHVNENYAREIMELHTMGVGSGYTQQDVQELARILTGAGINQTETLPKLPPDKARLYQRDGAFEYNPNRHDFGDKMFLGHVIHGSGYGEISQALDILARQPATAHHVSLKLATYFMGDDPPAPVVDRMAKAFQASDGDIAKVLETLFASPEFDASLGKAFKDPVHYAVSAIRTSYDQKVVVNPTPLRRWLERMGEGLDMHATPDGYPLASAAWDGPGQMTLRFEFAHAFGSGSGGLFRPDGAGAQDQPAFPQPQNALYFSAVDSSLSQPTRVVLAQAISPQDWNVLYLSSPEFMRR
jgi:uncharacterized protein (DUF1800 family)